MRPASAVLEVLMCYSLSSLLLWRLWYCSRRCAALDGDASRQSDHLRETIAQIAAFRTAQEGCHKVWGGKCGTPNPCEGGWGPGRAYHPQPWYTPEILVRVVTLVSKCQQSQGWAPRTGILVSVVTFEAMQLRGVSKVKTLAWLGHGFGLCRAQLLNPKPFHI